jgi:hypothetical protein
MPKIRAIAGTFPPTVGLIVIASVGVALALVIHEAGRPIF